MFDAIKNLFKSPKQKEKERRRAQRQAFRQAESAKDRTNDQVRELTREADTHWQAARDAAKAGQKAAAQRHLTSYRASQVLMTKLEQKKWVFAQQLTKLEAAQSDQDFAQALGTINQVMEIDPENVTDIFDETRDMLGEQEDLDRFWGSLYDKEMEGATGKLDDYIPSMDELSAELEGEVAAALGTPAPSSSEMSNLDERIDSGLDRARKLLDGDSDTEK